MSHANALDVLMDPVTGDLPDFTRMHSGMEIIAQRVRCRTLTHKGDWPLDVSVGIDWLGVLGQKPLDLEGLAAELALVWLDVPGVTQVQDLAWAQDGDAATITATLLTSLGEDLPVTVTPQDISTGNASIVVGGVIGHSGGVAP